MSLRSAHLAAQDHTHRRYRYKNGIDEQERAKNRTQSSVRSKVEHVFQVMNRCSSVFVKLRYRGLKKNAHRLFVTCALVICFSVGGTAAEDKRINAGEPLFALRLATAKPRNPSEMSSTPLGELRQDPAFPDRRTYSIRNLTYSESP